MQLNVKRCERVFKASLLVTVVASGLVIQGCNSTKLLGKQSSSHGYQINEQTLALVPEGSSREQVLLSLGTPSTTMRQADGTETLFYISQKKQRPVAFMRAKVVDQRVLAIYLDENEQVARRANYGLQDGKAFDFISRVTPTGGKELSFINQLLGAAGAVANPLGSSKTPGT